MYTVTITRTTGQRTVDPAGLATTCASAAWKPA
jgi:hypothetical protein